MTLSDFNERRKLTIVCGEFKPMVRNTLRGFATITIADMRMTFRDVALHEKNGSRWAALPSKPMLNRDGVALKDDSGKIKYVPLVEFDSKDVRDAFSAAVVAAVLKVEPRAFEDELA